MVHLLQKNGKALSIYTTKHDAPPKSVPLFFLNCSMFLRVKSSICILCISLYISYIHAVMLYYTVIRLHIFWCIIGFDAQWFFGWLELPSQAKFRSVSMRNTSQCRVDSSIESSFCFAVSYLSKQTSRCCCIHTSSVNAKIIHQSILSLSSLPILKGLTTHAKDDFQTSWEKKPLPTTWNRPVV